MAGDAASACRVHARVSDPELTNKLLQATHFVQLKDCFRTSGAEAFAVLALELKGQMTILQPHSSAVHLSYNAKAAFK